MYLNTIELTRKHQKLLRQVRMRLMGPDSGSMTDRKIFARRLLEALEEDENMRPSTPSQIW